MSKSGKGAATNKNKMEELSFEEALQKLESTVETMESGDLPLEKLLARYEEGMELAKVCQGKLAEAEVKIQKLEQSAKGAFTLKPIPADADDQ